MIGILDTEADWLATAWCLASGVHAHGMDAEAFLVGHKVGFLAGFLACRARPNDVPYDAYQRLTQRIDPGI